MTARNSRARTILLEGRALTLRHNLRARGPLLAVAVIGTAVAAQLAAMARTLLDAHASAPPSLPAQAGTMSQTPELDVDAILSARLFGARTVTDSTAVQTQLALALAGTIALTDPARGWAIVGDSARSGRLYAVGGTLPGGATLQAVYPDRIILANGSTLETLVLPRLSASADAPVATLAAAIPSDEIEMPQIGNAATATIRGSPGIDPSFSQPIPGGPTARARGDGPPAEIEL